MLEVLHSKLMYSFMLRTSCNSSKDKPSMSVTFKKYGFEESDNLCYIIYDLVCSRSIHKSDLGQEGNHKLENCQYIYHRKNMYTSRESYSVHLVLNFEGDHQHQLSIR